jgi:hypothetical protein
VETILAKPVTKYRIKAATGGFAFPETDKARHLIVAYEMLKGIILFPQVMNL